MERGLRGGGEGELSGLTEGVEIIDTSKVSEISREGVLTG